jgi:hypothetical protein
MQMRSLPLRAGATLILIVAFALLSSAVAQTAQDLSGNWQGTLQAGRDLRMVLKVS